MIKKYYKYDYYIQLNLQTTNGNSLKHMLAIGRETSKTEAGIKRPIIKSNEESKSPSKKQSPVKQAIKEEDFSKPHHNSKVIKPVASVFFRFSHRDKQHQALTNKEQKAIISLIYNNLMACIAK